MYQKYLSEMKRQKRTMTELAEYLGMTVSAVSKKFKNLRPWLLEECYAALEFLGLPLADMVIYFPYEGGEKAC